jgi:enterochelin esterase-like enzyme
MQLRPAVLSVFLAVLSTVASAQQQHLFFRVSLGGASAQPVSGRLILFLSKGTGAHEIDMSPFHPTETYVAAEEIPYLSPDGSVEIDTDGLVFPNEFSTLPEGDYQVQALLDVRHTYNYVGRENGDLVSDVLELKSWTPGQGSEPSLVLSSKIAQPDRKLPLSVEEQKAAEADTEVIDFISGLLTRFSGRETKLRGWVILPPGYRQHPERRYPTVYWTHGFGGTLLSAKINGWMLHRRMVQGKMPPMIWVMLDESLATGTHEFADSVNNGPWGAALTKELIPALEAKYRMDAKASGRFLQGHSSGGWATLQLQVNYPKIFGGTWSTSPDPSDFHDFTGVDLYAPHANLYHHPDGSSYPLVRDHGEVEATVEQFARLERVLGDYGGQLASFEWVFSPRGADGRPLQMFNRDTGDVDPAVVAYWHDHYDLAHIVTADWAARGPYLKGKIHLVVGTADTFYLDGAAHKFEAVLKGLGGNPHFTYREGRTHFDLYQDGDDRMAMFDRIAKEMYAVARPGGK